MDHKYPCINKFVPVSELFHIYVIHFVWRCTNLLFFSLAPSLCLPHAKLSVHTNRKKMRLFIILNWKIKANDSLKIIWFSYWKFNIFAIEIACCIYNEILFNKNIYHQMEWIVYLLVTRLNLCSFTNNTQQKWIYYTL